jgi:protein TonB
MTTHASDSSRLDVGISVGIHVGFIALLFILGGVLPHVDLNLVPENTPVKIIEKVTELPPATEVPKPLDIRKMPPPVPTPAAPPAFGINKNTLTSEGSGVQVKAGNTLAKPVDQIESKDALPVAVEEFLVTRMPKLKRELRIPYPEAAKLARVEGPVVMDILVDNEGRVRDAVLVDGPGSGLNEAALDAVKSFEFEPAQIEGKPVTVRIRYVYRFVLTN